MSLGAVLDNTSLIQSFNAFCLLTSPGYVSKQVTPPRLTQFELLQMIGLLMEDTFYEEQPYLAGHKELVRNLRGKAKWAALELTTHVETGFGYLPNDIVRHISAGFAETFTNCNIFGLCVGNFSHPEVVGAMLGRMDKKYRRRVLIFESHTNENNPSFECLDPFPATCLLVEQINSWPGLLVWAKSGEAALIPEASILKTKA